MMILGLNCRGCGQPEAVHELRALAERHRPEVLFLSETKMTAERAECLKWRLGFENALGVDSEGQSGGLVLLWRSGNVVRLKSKNKSHIDVLVSNDNLGGGEWRFTGFYGEPRRENRKDSWYLMHFLRSVSDMPWLCMGDFNEVLAQDEHFGRHEREDWQMAGFREAVEYCDFTDLGYSGLPYTWDNKQVGGDNVKARLDRVFGDDRFLRCFGATNVSTYRLLNLITVPCWSRCLADPDNVQTKFSSLFGMRICGTGTPLMWSRSTTLGLSVARV
jgi:hypothetical protein